MINDLYLKYKHETGNIAMVEIEADRLIPALDSEDFTGITGSEIRDMLNYDYKYNSKYGIFVDQLPVEYHDDLPYCINIYNPEYVKWLEEKVMELSKNIEKL